MSMSNIDQDYYLDHRNRPHTPPADPMLARLSQARTQLLLDHPEFGASALRLIFSDANPTSAPAATDGTYIYYTPDKLAAYTDGELVFIIAHETLHCVLLHVYRLAHVADTDLANKAADIVANAILIDAHVGTPPKGIRHDPTYAGLSVEQVVSKLRAKRDGERNQPPTDPNKHGDPGIKPQPADSNSNTPPDPSRPGTQPSTSSDPLAGDVTPPSPEQKQPQAGKPQPQPGHVKEGPQQSAQPASTGADQQPPDSNSGPQPPAPAPGMSELDWITAAEQDAMVSRKAGRMPGSLQRQLQAARAPKTDVADALRQFIERRAADDYSWQRPSRRWLVNANLYMPGLKADSTPPVVFVVDTSGSVNDRLLDQFGAIVNDVCQELKPRSVHVLYADTHVNRHDVFIPERGDEIKLTAPGRGGTAFGPSFAYLRDLAEGAPQGVLHDNDDAQDIPETCACVYLTDLQGNDNAGIIDLCPTSFPVLWAVPAHHCTDDARRRYPLPFGSILPIGPDM